MTESLSLIRNGIEVFDLAMSSNPVGETFFVFFDVGIAPTVFFSPDKEL